jgi:hypothetical protein
VGIGESLRQRARALKQETHALYRLIPPPVLAECRARAGEGLPVSRVAAVIIVLIWIALATVLGIWLYQAFH